MSFVWRVFRNELSGFKQWFEWVVVVWFWKRDSSSSTLLALRHPTGIRMRTQGKVNGEWRGGRGGRVGDDHKQTSNFTLACQLVYISRQLHNNFLYTLNLVSCFVKKEIHWKTCEF